MSLPFLYTALLCLSASFFAWMGTWTVRTLLRATVGGRDPNARDNHTTPTPKGGGLAMMIAMIGFLAVAGLHGGVTLALLLLTLVSFTDDVSGLKPWIRLLAHGIAACLIVFDLPAPVLHGLIPPTLEFPVLVFALVWCMNLTNFMDGIDEITSVHTVSVMLAVIALVAIAPDLRNALAYDSAIIISAVLGFWWFNRHPATIFMGDSGSIPLGALLGWMLLSLVGEGYWVAAACLPAYYLIDSGVTMLKRLASGHKPWEAHSTHAYQKAVRAGHSHCTVAYKVGICNLICGVLALYSVQQPAMALYCLCAAYGVSALLYLVFASSRATASRARAVMAASHEPIH
jgi:UDP-N-acetylmuramyl pentapeptide phosphotransferase/UDP-N-acetylglucosamine-1-phosphate transferase